MSRRRGSAASAEPTPIQQLRGVWAANLRAELQARRTTVKAFHHELVEAGLDVTVQAVYSWLAGTTSPSPVSQAWIAHVLQAPHERLFPLPDVPS